MKLVGKLLKYARNENIIWAWATFTEYYLQIEMNNHFNYYIVILVHNNNFSDNTQNINFSLAVAVDWFINLYLPPPPALSSDSSEPRRSESESRPSSSPIFFIGMFFCFTKSNSLLYSPLSIWVKVNAWKWKQKWNFLFHVHLSPPLWNYLQ